MVSTDIPIIIGQLIGAFAIGLSFGFFVAVFIMGGKTITK